jgi:predicted MPP superfamily phosphohydrolase
MQEFKNINFNVLLNESSSFIVNGKTVAVGGVHDLASHRINPNYRCDPDMAIAKNENADLKILLAHQPKSVQLIKKSKVDLVLSGHTHAGQFFPGSLFIFLFQPYVKGLHLVNDINLYINQGTGYWGPPNRLGTESEISFIELV